MTNESRQRPPGNPVALAVTLTVPPPWSGAIAGVAATLCAEFALEPLPPFAPHISLCRPFCCAAAPEAVAPVVEEALRRLSPTPVDVGGVGRFHQSGGSPEVIYVAARAPWLAPLNRRLVRRTERFRCAADVLVAVSGNPEYDLDDYTPHITLAIVRGLSARPARRHRLAERAAALWAARRPAADGFPAGEVVLSVLDAGEPGAWPPVEAVPHVVAAWRLRGAGSLHPTS